MQPKSLTTTTQETNINNKMVKHSSFIKLPEEKWELLVTTVEEDYRTARELALISIRLPNGRFFTCTIQDLQNMEAIARNAKKELMEYAENGFTDKGDEAETLDCIKEVDHLLSFFIP